MSIEGVIAAVVMGLVGAFWLARPILRRKTAASGAELARQKEREALLTTYERTLASLRDVDEDHLTGKLAPADYERERAYWTEQGGAVLQALESLDAPKTAKPSKPARPAQPPPAADADAVLDEAIEQAIARYIKSTH